MTLEGLCVRDTWTLRMSERPRLPGFGSLSPGVGKARCLDTHG